MAVMGLKMSQDEPALTCCPLCITQGQGSYRLPVGFGAFQELSFVTADQTAWPLYRASLPHPLGEPAKPCSQPASGHPTAIMFPLLQQ